jgi:hypothetical protein
MAAGGIPRQGELRTLRETTTRDLKVLQISQNTTRCAGSLAWDRWVFR